MPNWHATDRKWMALDPREREPFVKCERYFFGPRITLARRLAQASLLQPTVIKIGFFGSNLAADWQPVAATGDRLYATMLAEIIHALRQLEVGGLVSFTTIPSGYQ